MNYMKQIAQMLEVELDEEFNVTGNNGDALLIIKEDGIYRLFKSKWVKTKYFLDLLLTGKIKIIKKPILDDNEKEYLCNVIKPLQIQVKEIRKVNYDDKWEQLIIEYENKIGESYMIIMPIFDKGTMYRGMDTNISYVPEELGL